jgi:LysR family glycine cleavage system transcriptional activator
MPDRLPPLTALKAFEAASRLMSFQAAAEELAVTPAALSYQIRQLEDHLGLKLFNRLNRAVELTEHGRLMRPGIHEAFEQMHRTMRQLRRRQQTNVLTIAAGPAFTAKWLSPRLYRFIGRHPNIDARISASVAKSDLETDDIDVAIRFGPGVYAGHHSVKLLDEFMTPLCAPSLLEGPNPLRSPEDLEHHTLIHDETHQGFFILQSWADWLNAAGVTNVDPNKSGLHFNVADHALDAAAGGGGVVLGRTSLAEPDMRAGRLVAPFELRMKTDYSFYLICLESRKDEPAIAAFRNWMQDEIAGAPDAENLPGPAI